jgi:hypothetical protein
MRRLNTQIQRPTYSISESSAPQRNGPRNEPQVGCSTQIPTQLHQYKSNMPITYHDIEEKVIEACYDLAEQEFPNMRATARKYEVPRGRLQRRWTWQSDSYIESGGANKALDDETE